MALILDKSSITSLGIIRPWHVSQSVDAFTGIEAYDITISGSLITIGPFVNDDGDGNFNIDSLSRTLYDSTSIDSINWNSRRLYDTSGTPALSWTNGITAASFNVDDLVINNSGFINGSPILTQAGATGYVTSVNGIFPTNGNVSTGITAVITGDSASLVVSSSGAPTGSIGEGTVWVISGDPNPNNNGDAYIFSSGPPGVWYPISPLDVPAADARYILKNGNDSHTGSLYISGSSIELSLSGTLSVHHPGTNTININSNSRTLFDSTGVESIYWGTRFLSDTSNVFSIDWDARNLFDLSSVLSLDWGNRQLLQSNSNLTLDWENAIFSGSVHGTSSWADSASYAVTAAFSPNFANTDLTFDGMRSHNTDGNIFQITTDAGVFNESWLYQESPGISLGYKNAQLNIGDGGGGSTLIGFRTSSIGGDYVFLITGSNVIINDQGQNVDFRIEGDTDPNLFFTDASVDRVGIGKNTPSAKLDVNGNTLITGSLTTTSTISSPSTPTVGVLNNTSDANLTVNADSYGIARWVANFTSTRNLSVSNLSEGQSVKVYVRNTNATARAINIQASSGVLLPTSVVCSRGGSAGQTFASLNGSGGTATIWVSNVGGSFIGAIY